MNSVLNYLAKHEKQFIQELCDYVRFPSVSAQSTHRKDMTACAQWLSKQCQSMGLTVKIHPTPGHPILVARTRSAKLSKARKKPHFLVYGHYDVQPPDPLNLWKTPPFEPTIRGRSLFGRGASDNKGQNLAHLKAAEAYLKTGTELPCDLTFVIEGEEEVGSKHLADFLQKHKKDLQCDAVVISDTGIPSVNHPALTYGLRGIAALEIKVEGPSRDLHSGIYGGSLNNPAMALCQLLAQMRDRQGRVTIPGFYDQVRTLSKYERRQLGRLPFNQADYRKFLGVDELFGETGFSAVEQRSSRTTF